MAAGSNVELSIGAVLENSVEIYVHNQFASETGEVIVFDSNSTEVARSSTITVYQSSTSVTITGLDGGTEYTAKFYSETVGDYSLSTLDFTTLRHNKLYGPVNSQATRVSELYGSVNGEAELANKVYGPAEETIYVADWDDTYLTSFDSNAFFSKLEQTYPGEIPLGISLNKGYISQIGVTVYSLNLTTDQTQGGTPHLIDNGQTTSVVDTARQWGFNPNSAFSSSESALAIVRFSAESESVSKLIHQGFGHLDYS